MDKVEALQLSNDKIDTRGNENKREDCLFKLDAAKGVLSSNPDHPHSICGSSHGDCFDSMVHDQIIDKTAFMKNGKYIVGNHCTAFDLLAISPFGVLQLTKHVLNVQYLIRHIIDLTIICLNSPRAIILLPCWHKVYCEKCHDVLESKHRVLCQICRTIVESDVCVIE